MFTFKKVCAFIFQIALALTASTTMLAQCVNVDFESGTFANWQGATGSSYPGAPIPAFNTMTPGIVNGRHTIMTGAGVDPFTGQPVVAPGSNFSARLGNSGIGAQYERLRYAFTVTANSTLLIYKYAVVFENPSSHTNAEMPRFEVSIRNQNGNIIPCTLYEVFAGSGIPGFQNAGSGIVFRPWTTVGVDLTAYIGQTITLEFGTADCYQTGHFGYAYVDAACGPLQIDARYCVNNSQGVLTAPPGFNYLWSTGQTTQSIIINNPQQGQQVSCTITSITGCVATLNTVLSPSSTIADFVVTNNCMGNATFTDSSIYNNGSAGPHFWDFGDGATDTSANPVHAYANPGTYNITLIAENDIGCSDTITQPVTIYPAAIAAFTYNNACEGSVVTFTDQSTISQGALNQWNWDLGNNTPPLLTQNGSYVYPDTGMYNVTLIVSANGQCPDTLTQQVSIKANPIADFAVTDVCLGTQSVFTNQSTTYWGNVTYNWNFGVAGGTSTQQSPTYTYANNGAYNISLIVTQTTPTNTCSDTIVQPLNINAVPAANFTSDQYLCLGEQTVFTNQSTISTGEALTYAWNFGDNSTSALTSPTHTYANYGTFTATLITSTGKGCADTIQYPQNIYAVPSAVVAPDVTSGCEPLAVNYVGQSTVAAGNITGWAWNLGNSNTSTAQNPTVSYPYGTYNVELVVAAGDANNTCYDTATYTINSYAVPVAAFTSDQYLCLGEATVFTNQSNVASNETLASDWNFGDNATSALTAPTHTYANFGTFTAELIVTTPNGCSDTTSAPQNIYAIPVAGIVTDINAGCQPITVNYTGQGTVGLGNITGFDWDLSTSSSTSQNTSSTYTNPGQYNIELVVAAGDANNTCYDTTTTVIDVYALPVADFSTANNCYGVTTGFNNLSNVSAGFIQNYDWDFGNAAGTSTLSDPFYLYPADGNYNVQLIVTTDNNCKDTIVNPITIYPLPIVNFVGDTLEGCDPLLVDFSDLSTVSGGTIVDWDWNFGDNNSSIEENPTHIFSNAGSYTVSLTVTSNEGCVDSVQFVNYVTVRPNPVAEFFAEPMSLDELNAENSVIETTNLSQGATYYQWNFGNGDSTNVFEPTVSYSAAGRYVITLYVENQWGCSDQTSREINVTPVFTFYVPNSFTPNADGDNDRWGGFGTNIKTYEMNVFNRWGEKIFTSPTMNFQWDGELKGQRVQDEVYVYVCKVVDIMGGEHVYRGTVTLIR